ncbi:MAG: toprim domain-containing protein [Caldilineaceae bacterium]|nr:toprim domain-containing protein [Caldilineaceae bacterium]
MRTNRIPIAAAAEVAARLPFPHTTSGGWYRTSTAICHGGDSRTALSFQDGDRPGDSPLRVHCHSHNCDPTAVRHALQQATGLWLCRCDACFAAFRAGHPPPGAETAPPQGAQQPSGNLRWPERAKRCPSSKNAGNGAQGRSAPGQGKDTNAYAAELWAAAQASTTGPASQHPASKWLAERSLWPPAAPLPESVRWLPRRHRKFPRGRADSTAAGALVMAMRPLDNPAAPPRKIQLITIDKAGRKARHWPDNADKRTYGTGPFYGLLWRGRLRIAACDLHICEGLADGLRILRYATGPALVAVCAGTSYARIEPGCFDSITLWPDADEPGVKSAAKAAQRWADQGCRVSIKRLAAGHDPASAPLQDPAHE